MPNAKQYAKCKERWVENHEAYIKEKQRINEAVKNKYKNDPEFRERCIQYQRNRTIQKQQAKCLNDINCLDSN